MQAEIGRCDGNARMWTIICISLSEKLVYHDITIWVL
jgi:DNA-binding cell septation regulator SpoVG